MLIFVKDKDKFDARRRESRKIFTNGSDMDLRNMLGKNIILLFCVMYFLY